MDPKDWEAYLNRTFGSNRSSGSAEIKEDGSFLTSSWQSSKKFFPHYNQVTLLRHFIRKLSAKIRPYDAHNACHQFEVKSRLPLIKCPTLIMCGNEDVVFPLFEVAKSLIPLNKALVIEGAGSGICLEKPEEFAQACLDFLKEP